MEFLPLQPLSESMFPTANQIRAMCQRTFGASVRIISARQLSGGTFNTTFLIALHDQQVILRIAPTPTADLLWNEHWLMRHEQHIQPFFAALASLMPRIVLADFTHQLIGRDYMFQTYLPGERWDESTEQYTPTEQLQLWEQFGSITKTIHASIGTRFGGPYPAPEFATWSEAVLYRLECTTQAMIEAQLDVADFRSVLAIVQAQRAQLDTIEQPHLLHGDLWLFNILINRDVNGPIITGILDADRAWWGDPLADWTMFVLAMSAGPETDEFYTRFWQGYGEVIQTPESRFRQTVYEVMHIGTALAWASHHGDHDTVQRGKRDLHAVTKRLQLYAT